MPQDYETACKFYVTLGALLLLLVGCVGSKSSLGCLLLVLETLEFLCDCCTAEGREIEVLRRFEVLQGLLEDCGFSGGVVVKCIFAEW